MVSKTLERHSRAIELEIYRSNGIRNEIDPEEIPIEIQPRAGLDATAANMRWSDLAAISETESKNGPSDV